LLKNLLRRLRPFRFAVLAIAAGLLMEMAFNGLWPLALRFLVDALISGGSADQITVLLSALAVGAIAASATGFLRDRAWARTQQGSWQDFARRCSIIYRVSRSGSSKRSAEAVCFPASRAI
jgi:ABC-type multidrug transport system fused ATPase/permease subunit